MRVKIAAASLLALIVGVPVLICSGPAFVAKHWHQLSHHQAAATATQNRGQKLRLFWFSNFSKLMKQRLPFAFPICKLWRPDTITCSVNT
jgi:hypothetical protein